MVAWSPFQHEVLRWLEVVGLVGADPVHLQPRLAVTGADRTEAAQALADAGAGGDGAPLVALHPGATDPRRRWPPQRLAAVGNAVAAQAALLWATTPDPATSPRLWAPPRSASSPGRT
jgi:ADP-heptose:LPS heptosyltransferase